MDWNLPIALKPSLFSVTPCVGVWIETLTPTLLYFANYVTPCVGVWIETHLILMRWSLHSVTPCVGVWIETFAGSPKINAFSSHPAWVCGLKLFSIHHTSTSLRSHPAWVCGLKQGIRLRMIVARSHTLRGCVDWNSVKQNLCLLSRVTPCVGVWIETVARIERAERSESHPAWVCGLKQYRHH